MQLQEQHSVVEVAFTNESTDSGKCLEMHSILYFLIGLLVFDSVTGNFPSDVQKCKPKDVKCIAKVVTDLVRNHPKGKSDIGLPQTDPFHLDTVEVNQDGTQGVSLKLKFKDIDVSGLSKITVEKIDGFDVDPETSKFEFSTRFPALNINAKYAIDGKILILPIQGNGNGTITLENARIAVKFKPTVKNDNGKIYLGIKKLKVLLEPEKMIISLTNLFNGDKILGDNMNKFLNENEKDVWTEVSPAINEAVTEIVRNILTNVFSKITYDEFYVKD